MKLSQTFFHREQAALFFQLSLPPPRVSKMACCYRGTVTARASTSGAVAAARRSHAAPAGPLLSTRRRGCLSLGNKMLFCKPVNVPFAPLALPALASSPSPFLCSAACSGAREHHFEQALEEEACDFVDSWSDDKRALFFARSERRFVPCRGKEAPLVFLFRRSRVSLSPDAHYFCGFGVHLMCYLL